jgi:erythromycin esterase-like protein
MNRYVRDASDDGTAEEALRDFRRFPAWMWRNTDVVDFIEWLREWNESRPSGEARAGFYGLDLYSLHTSMEAVVAYLDRVDPEAAQRARERYSCFDHFGPDPQVYAYVAGVGGAEPCEEEVVQQLVELRNRAAELASWNLRDLHMAETLEALVGHLERTQGPTKAVAPAHNSHVGDQPCSRPVPPTAIAYLADQGSRLARQCCASGRQS